MRVLFLFLFLSISIQSKVVETTSGIVEGYKKNGVINWDDIPYAQAPIGNLRWKAPKKINNPSAIITSKENNFCVQRPSGMGGSEGHSFFFWY